MGARHPLAGRTPRRRPPFARELLQGLERFTRFSREAAAAPDEVAVFRLAVRAAMDVFRAAHAAILGIDGRAGRFRVAAAVGLDPLTVERFSLGLDEGLAGRALQLRRPVESAVKSDPRFVTFDWQTDRFERALCVPMFLRDRQPVGVLSLGGRFPFGTVQQQLALTLANLTAAAVENTRLLSDSRRTLSRLEAVLEAARSIQSMVGLDETLRCIVEDAVRVVSGAECGVLMLLEQNDKLAVKAQVGYPDAELDSLRLGPGEGYAGQVLQRRRPMIFRRLQGSRLAEPLSRQLPANSQALGVKSAVGAPVLLGNRILGVLAVESRTSEDAFSEADLEVLTGLASHAAIAVERARLVEQRRELYLSGVRTLVAAIDARDPSARGHSDRVAFYSRRVAEAMGMSPSWVERVELAALLHDVGKIGVTDLVLRKTGPLEPAERAVMMAHVELGAQILSANRALKDLVPLVRHHHEWYSGGGYPDGLKGDAIPLGAAIISVADAFDTMTTGRPYRAASTLEDSLAELERCAGTQFHPEVVRALFRALKEDEAKGAAYVFQLRAWQWEAGEAAQAAETPQTETPGERQPEAPSLRGAHVVSPPQEQAGRITPVQTKQLSALYRLAQAMRDVLDLPQLLQHVIRIIQSELGFQDCCVFLVDAETDELSMAAAAGAFSGLEGLRLKKDQGVSGWVATHGLPVLVPDVSQEPRYYPGPPSTRSEVVVPMIAGARVIGTLTVDSTRLNAFSVEEVQLLTTVAQQAAVAVEVAQLHEQARRAAMRDGLTDLFNHRRFYERLEEELERAGRYGHGLVVALGDVDRLKDVNDNLGHLAGDAVLVELARALRANSRRYDVLARYGGDEFAIIMPQTDRQGALVAIERIDRAVAKASFNWYGVNLELPRISWGLASFPEDGRRSSELVAAADQRMYLAKRERAYLGESDRDGGS